MKKIALALTCLSVMSCTSVGHKADVAAVTPQVHRSAASNDLQVELRNVAALLKGYFSAPGAKKGETTIQGYSAYVLEPTGDGEFGHVVIYMDNPNDPFGKQILTVDNDKFLSTGGAMAGDEPSLATNHRDSLLIQSGNDGYGRTAWHQTVTVAWRNNQLVVAGFDYSDYDRLGEDEETNCSVNLLTGKGVLTKNPAREANPNGKPKVTKFNVPTTPVLLANWTEQSVPKGCGFSQ